MQDQFDSGAPVRRPGEGCECPVFPDQEHTVGPEIESAVYDNAARAFDAFYNELKVRFGVPDPELYGERNPDWGCFVQLAVICLGKGWDVVEYVRKAFDKSRRSSRCMAPKDLVSSQAVKVYEGLPDSGRDSDAKAEYDRCQTWLLNREMDGWDERPLLLSPTSPLPAWFRVIYPEKVDVEIVKAWGEVAKAEFSAIPRRMELAKSLFPANWEKLRRMLWMFPETEGV